MCAYVRIQARRQIHSTEENDTWQEGHVPVSPLNVCVCLLSTIIIPAGKRNLLCTIRPPLLVFFKKEQSKVDIPTYPR